MAHVFANFPSVSFYWTLTTLSAKIFLLPVEPDVIGIVMGMRRVTEKMINRFLSRTLPPFPALFAHGVVRKLVESANKRRFESVIFRYTVVFKIQFVFRADRGENVGIIVMNIVVFELVVVGQA